MCDESVRRLGQYKLDKQVLRQGHVMSVYVLNVISVMSLLMQEKYTES